MSSKKLHLYHCIPQERVLRAVLLLSGHEAAGLAPTEISKALGISASLVTRDLWNLEQAGFAEQITGGRWRLGPKLVQVALAFQRGIETLKRSVDEIEQRYTRSPK